MILAAANRQADPRTRDRLPLPNRVLATPPFVALGVHGVLALSVALAAADLLAVLPRPGSRRRRRRRGRPAGLRVLAYLTTRFVENPLRYRVPAAPPPQARCRCGPGSAARRSCSASVVTLLGVALTATSFTWREHVTVATRQRYGTCSCCPSATIRGRWRCSATRRCRRCRCGPRCWKPKRTFPKPLPTAVSATSATWRSAPAPTATRAATRTIALAGGSHAEHWITALDALGKLHHFKVVTYLKMGCPLTTEQLPLIVGDNIPYPQCRQWVQDVMTKLITDHPDFVFTNSTRPRFGRHGDEMPSSFLGIWDALSRNNIGILGIRDTPWMVRARPAVRACRLPCAGWLRDVVWDETRRCAQRHEPDAGLRRRSSRCSNRST